MDLLAIAKNAADRAATWLAVLAVSAAFASSRAAMRCKISSGPSARSAAISAFIQLSHSAASRSSRRAQCCVSLSRLATGVEEIQRTNVRIRGDPRRRPSEPSGSDQERDLFLAEIDPDRDDPPGASTLAVPPPPPRADATAGARATAAPIAAVMAKSDDCFSNHHGKSPRWNDIPRQRQP
jgi:hypothetical protein